MVAKVRKPKKTFADIAAARPRYNPEVEGYGNPREWRGAFYERMGFEEAQRVVSGQDKSPYEILGVLQTSTWDEIKSAYRKLSKACHPDRIVINNMTLEAATEAFKLLSGAFSVLAHKFGK
jgi:DnaJ domain